MDNQGEVVLIESPEDIVAIHLTTEEFEVQLNNVDNIWWVLKPKKYLANQDFILRTLKIMNQTPSIQKFQLEEDRYGFDPGEAFYRFIYKDHQEIRLVIGKNDAPGNNIYVLDKDSGWVYVLHNLWAQFLIHPMGDFYSPYLPIPGKMVRSISYFEKDKKLWQLISLSKEKVRLSYKELKFDSPKEDWEWFFEKVREISLGQLQFDSTNDFKIKGELHIQTEEGNIIIQVSEDYRKVFIPNLKLIGELSENSIQSLQHELKKVVESATK